MPSPHQNAAMEREPDEAFDFVGGKDVDRRLFIEPSKKRTGAGLEITIADQDAVERPIGIKQPRKQAAAFRDEPAGVASRIRFLQRSVWIEPRIVGGIDGNERQVESPRGLPGNLTAWAVEDAR